MDDSREAVGTEAETGAYARLRTDFPGKAEPQSKSMARSSTQAPYEADEDDEAFWSLCDPLEADDEGYFDDPAVEAHYAAEDSENLPPHFVDLFAGEHFPIARAMIWCGWTASVYERGLCEDELCKDLTDPDIQEEAMGQLKRAQASWAAMDCKTLTRKREQDIPDHPNPPRPLRGEGDLWGADAVGKLSAGRRSSGGHPFRHHR